MKKKILHVSEAFGGGIVSSIYSFATNSADFEHHLLISERKDQPLNKDLEERFSSISLMRKDILRAIEDIREAVDKLKPDHIHLHSTFAGVYGRLAGLKAEKTIYSPHGFAFQRVSDGPILRAAFLAIEWILSSRASSFAGVSPYELDVWRKFQPQGRSVFVPNSTDIPYSPVSRVVGVKTIKLTCAGRIAAQKDPQFLLQVEAALPKAHRQTLDICWVGAGDPKLTDKLAKAGVRVTGWVPHSEAERELAQSTLYFHTAAWEGFPMTVIEAAAMGKPILLRRISAFEKLGFPAGAMVSNPSEAAAKLASWPTDSHLQEATYAASELVRSLCSPEAQRAALLRLYHENAR